VIRWLWYSRAPSLAVEQGELKMTMIMEKCDFKLMLGVLVILLLAQLLDGCALDQVEEAPASCTSSDVYRN